MAAAKVTSSVLPMRRKSASRFHRSQRDMTFGLLKGFLDGAGFFFMELFEPYGAFAGPKFKPQTMNSV
jgi:hypothetical protein